MDFHSGRLLYEMGRTFRTECATAKECVVTLVEDVFLRYGPNVTNYSHKRVISDNGAQFLSGVIQK